MKKLIEKYDKQGPRYTSYPPVPFWKEAPTQKNWFEHVQSNYDETQGVDLYVHIPFCEVLCYYCGCNRVINKNKSVQDPYVDAILKEWSIYKEQMGSIKINSLHLGGGTPTFLTPSNLKKILTSLLENKKNDYTGSIEVDPRTCTIEHLEVLKEAGFSRISMGIQDFDSEVQAAINREQSYEMVEELVKKVRQMEFSSLNFDLIYGLPKQTWAKMEKTLDLVFKLNPDMFAFYSYAHVPWKIKNQKLIKEEELPLGEEKLTIYLNSREKYLTNNYIEVGLDHFASKKSPLGIAQINKTLTRNFMGYTDKKSNMIIGLGVSSISASSVSFIQNERTMAPYMERISKGELPIVAGHIHTKIDLEIDELLQEIMCKGRWQMPSRDKCPDYDQIIDKLEEMQTDGLLSIDKGSILVHEKGRPFLRNMAMLFDVHLKDKKTQERFSRTV